jgi:hypothetical protein
VGDSEVVVLLENFQVCFLLFFLLFVVCCLLFGFFLCRAVHTSHIFIGGHGKRAQICFLRVHANRHPHSKSTHRARPESLA